MANLSDLTVKWLDAGGCFPEVLTITSAKGQHKNYKILDRDQNGKVLTVASRKGYKGFVLKVSDTNTNLIYAAKLCLYEDYEDPTHIEDEILNASYLSKFDSIVTHQKVGKVSAFSNQPIDAPNNWLCFISEWVNGYSLEHVIEKKVIPLKPSLIISIIRELVAAVLRIQSKSLKHDDLHLGNLMLEKVDDIEKAMSPSAPHFKLKNCRFRLTKIH